MEFQVVPETIAKKIFYTCIFFNKHIKQILIIFFYTLEKALLRIVYRKQLFISIAFVFKI